MINHILTKYSKIVVLSGGDSYEHEISLLTGHAVFNELSKAGYINALLFEYRESSMDIILRIRNINPDIVFIALHGGYGENGTIQAIFDWLGIKYTSSKVLSSSICMNKYITKILCKALDIKTPFGYVINKKEFLESKKLPYPYVVKPISCGSSFCVCCFFNDLDYKKNKDIYINSKYTQFLIEEYIDGIELTVGVLCGKILGILELTSNDCIIGYEDKCRGNVSYLLPKSLSSDLIERLKNISVYLYKSLSCSGLIRIDFKYNPKVNEFYLIEINTHPGLTKKSSILEIAKNSNVTFLRIIEEIIKEAV